MKREPVYKLVRQHIEQQGLKKNFVAVQAGIDLKRFYRLIDGTTLLGVDEYVNICVNGLSISPTHFMQEYDQGGSGWSLERS